MLKENHYVTNLVNENDEASLLAYKGGDIIMREAVIVAGARTPIGKAKKGSLAQMRPDDFGALL